MTIEVNARPGRLKAVSLVRDKDQNPQFDDWDNIPEIFHRHLSAQDWAYIEQKRSEK